MNDELCNNIIFPSTQGIKDDSDLLKYWILYFDLIASSYPSKVISILFHLGFQGASNDYGIVLNKKILDTTFSSTGSLTSPIHILLLGPNDYIKTSLLNSLSKTHVEASNKIITTGCFIDMAIPLGSTDNMSFDQKKGRKFRFNVVVASIPYHLTQKYYDSLDSSFMSHICVLFCYDNCNIKTMKKIEDLLRNETPRIYASDKNPDDIIVDMLTPKNSPVKPTKDIKRDKGDKSDSIQDYLLMNDLPELLIVPPENPMICIEKIIIAAQSKRSIPLRYRQSENRLFSVIAYSAFAIGITMFGCLHYWYPDSIQTTLHKYRDWLASIVKKK